MEDEALKKELITEILLLNPPRGPEAYQTAIDSMSHMNIDALRNMKHEVEKVRPVRAVPHPAP